MSHKPPKRHWILLCIIVLIMTTQIFSCRLLVIWFYKNVKFLISKLFLHCISLLQLARLIVMQEGGGGTLGKGIWKTKERTLTSLTIVRTVFFMSRVVRNHHSSCFLWWHPLVIFSDKSGRCRSFPTKVVSSQHSNVISLLVSLFPGLWGCWFFFTFWMYSSNLKGHETL